VRDTSRLAYDALDLNAGQFRIVAFLRDHHPKAFTRAELARASGIPINAVCGRVNELLKLGALEELVRRGCTTSGKQAHPVRLAPVQKELPR